MDTQRRMRVEQIYFPPCSLAANYFLCIVWSGFLDQFVACLFSNPCSSQVLAVLPFETYEFLIFTQLSGNEAASYMEKYLLVSCWILHLLLVLEKRQIVDTNCPFCDIHDSVDLFCPFFSQWVHLTLSLVRMLQISSCYKLVKYIMENSSKGN